MVSGMGSSIKKQLHAVKMKVRYELEILYISAVLLFVRADNDE